MNSEYNQPQSMNETQKDEIVNKNDQQELMENLSKKKQRESEVEESDHTETSVKALYFCKNRLFDIREAASNSVVVVSF